MVQLMLLKYWIRLLNYYYANDDEFDDEKSSRRVRKWCGSRMHILQGSLGVGRMIFRYG